MGYTAVKTQTTHKNARSVTHSNLLSLQDYLEQRHGPAIAQVLIDDLVTIEDVKAAA